MRAISKATAGDRRLVFINISGVSLYPCDGRERDESESGVGTDFMSNLCLEWEKAAQLPAESQCRSVKIRTGVVLGRDGGMIQNLYLPFYLGLGGPIGKGTQPLPWIHIDDLCRLIQFAIEKETVTGVLNGTAPDIVTNLEFSKQFARALRRPAAIPLPEAVVKLIFGQERSVLLTTGPKVVPKRTLETGFRFEYPTIAEACRQLAK